MRPSTRRVPALLVVALVAACGDDAKSVPYEQLLSVSSAAYPAPARVLIRDEATWAVVWPELAPALATPAIDFSKDMVIVVALGARADARSHASITRVALGDDLEVTVTE